MRSLLPSWPAVYVGEVLDYAQSTGARCWPTSARRSPPRVVDYAPSGSDELTVPAFTTTGTVSTVWVEPLIAGRIYIVRMNVLTAGGRIFEQWCTSTLMPNLRSIRLPTRSIPASPRRSRPMPAPATAF
jgi:hypothetical protein